ncbi:MAG: hypothetical protein ACLTW9_04955 [Enterocloster sp.]
MKGRGLRAVVLLLVAELWAGMLGLVLMYVVIVVVSAVIVTLFVDSYAAMAVLAAVCTKAGSGSAVHWQGYLAPGGGFWRSDR